MVDTIGSCVICAQNLCISNFSSLPCGHTFHYKCIVRWLLYADKCPTCRARTSPRNIVKRLYFASCDDKAVNSAGTPEIVAVTDHNNKFASRTNRNAQSTRTPENIDEFDSDFHGNDESCSSISSYDNDSEDGANGTDSDFTDGNDQNMISSEGSESATELEEESEEELEYQEIFSETDMVNVLDASVSVTSSDSFGTFSESFSEIDDAVSISSLDHDNMEIFESLNDHEVSNDDDNIFTSVLLIEYVNDNGGDSSDDSGGSNSDGNTDSNSDCDLHNYDHF